MKIYAFSGLGADERVFDALNLDYDLEVLKWKPFLVNETMNSYAMKMIEGIDLSIPHSFLGISFGGMLVAELSKMNSNYIIISSVINQSELPWWFRLKIPVYRFPTILFKITRTWVFPLFGAQNKTLIKNILRDTDPKFIKNALRLIINWKRTKKGKVYRIHGDNDLIIPKPIVEIETVNVPVSSAAKFALKFTDSFALYIELCSPPPIGVALISLTS